MKIEKLQKITNDLQKEGKILPMTTDVVFKNTKHISNKILEKRKISDLIVDMDKMIVNLELNAWMKDVAKNMLKSNEPINKIIKYIVFTREELDFLE